MKKGCICLLCLFFLLSAMAVASGSAVESDELKLYDENTRYVMKSFGEGSEGPFYATIPTYRKETTNDITYVSIEDFVDIICSDMKLSLEKVGGNSFNVLNSDHLCVLHIDAENNIVTYYRQDLIWPEVLDTNNGVTGEPANLSSVLIESERSAFVGTLKNEIIDLNDYHLGFILNDGGCYAPIELLSAIFNKGILTGVQYNGVDIYPLFAIDSSDSGAYKSFYANADRFMVDETHEAVKAAPASDEAYRFTYSDTEDDVTTYYSIRLRRDGSGGLYKSSDEDAPGEIVTEEKMYFVDFEVKNADVAHQFKWYETEEGLFIDPYYESGDEETNASMNNEEDLFKIPKRDSRYGTGVRSREVAELNLNLLAFTFEKCYGLTETKFPDGFYKQIDDHDLREGLLDTDSLVYDDALLTLTMGLIDDCHTAYMARSIYSGHVEEDMMEVRRAHWGERRTALENYANQYKALRTEVMSQADPKYEDEALQQGLFVEGSTAVIRFDVFEIYSLAIGNQPAEEADISEQIVVDTVDGVELAFREIAKNQDIKNVVFDLTCNTGGVISIAPYLLGYMTDDPEIMVYSSIRDIGADMHYRADINRDGVFDENDTLKDRYRFYILTSEASFSCANTLPTIAKNKGIPILGHRSAGGACPEIIYRDTCGSKFYSSAEMMIGTFSDEGEFTSSDGGVEPDYVLEPEYWYDLTKLNQFIESLENQ